MEFTLSFVELPVSEIKSTKECSISFTTAAVICGANEFIIELHENASAEFMRNLIGACT